MTDIIPIYQRDPALEKFTESWKRNREVIEGARSIRAVANKYIPPLAGMSPDHYRAYIARIPFYPGAARTAEGLKGLMFRRPSTVTHPASVKDILDTITAQGYTVDDLAEELADELLATNFCGLLVDYPVSAKGLSKANAISLGYRPFIALYKADSILGIETAVINNRQRVVRVRLLDNEKTVRELRLDDQVYSITIHRQNDGGQWTADAPIIPTKAGKPLDEIPFTLATTGRQFAPSKAPLDDVCDLNVQHYAASANLATCHYFSSAPVYIVAGAETVDKEGKAIAYSVAPGSIWTFGSEKVKAEILEYNGNAVESLRNAVKDIKEQMADVGSRILSNDKAAAEAAETLAIRHASENATLASLARVISRKLSDALAWVAWWLDLDEKSITFELNTDYTAQPMSSQDITTRMVLWQEDAISLETFLNMMIEADVLPEKFDIKADQAKVAQAVADRPTLSTDTRDLEDGETA